MLNVAQKPEQVLASALEVTAESGCISFLQPSHKMDQYNIDPFIQTTHLNKKEAAYLRMWQERSKKSVPEKLEALFAQRNLKDIKIKYYFNEMLFALSATLPPKA